jgi:hypothetical protein
VVVDRGMVPLCGNENLEEIRAFGHHYPARRDCAPAGKACLAGRVRAGRRLGRADSDPLAA